ncbi:MAG TPA: hypothetical protein PK963_00505 [Arachnia sp.]|nr:hypothetical protein [Arachnia sp.]
MLTNAGGNGVDLANDTTVSGIDIAGASGDGVNGLAISTASVGSGVPMTISGSGSDGIDLSGAGSGPLTLGATVTTSTSRSLALSGRSGGGVVVSGSLSGTGVELSSNTGATISFTGALALTTTTTRAFSATGGGTVSTSGSPNTAASGSGGAVIVENTTIGASGITFRSASANGAVNGIRLTNTGATAGLTVTGTGSVAQGGDASGGTITGTSGPGILLTNTRNPSFNNVSLLSVATAAGVKGSTVTGFSFTNGRVSGSGLAGSSLESANLAFNSVSAGGLEPLRRGDGEQLGARERLRQRPRRLQRERDPLLADGVRQPRPERHVQGARRHRPVARFGRCGVRGDGRIDRQQQSAELPVRWRHPRLRRQRLRRGGAADDPRYQRGEQGRGLGQRRSRRVGCDPDEHQLHLRQRGGTRHRVRRRAEQRHGG